jgi:hypothetical protein
VADDGVAVTQARDVDVERRLPLQRMQDGVDVALLNPVGARKVTFW